MISPILGRSGNDNATLQRFVAPQSTQFMSPVVTEANGRSVMADSGTLSNWFIKRTTAPGAGTSVTYVLKKNGSDTALTINIADTATTGQDTTNSASYVAGDVFGISITPTGTVTASGLGHSIENDSSGQVLMTGEVGAALPNAAISYLTLQGSSAEAALTSLAIPIPTGGTISRLYLDVTVAPGAAKSWTATLVVNGSDTALTCVVSGAAQTQNSDTTNSVAVSAGDTAYWRINPSGTPSTARGRISAKFTPTIDGESIQTFASSVNLATSGNQFSGISGGANAYSTSESGRFAWLGSTFDIKKLYAKVDTAPSAGKSWTFTARSNAADTALTTSIADTNTSNNNIANTVTPTTGALMGINTVGTSTPTASPAQWGFVTYRAPAGSPTFVPKVVMM